VRWLDNYNLSVEKEIPQEGTFVSMKIEGAYQRATYLDPAEFFALDGSQTRILDNAEYTMGIITEGEDGVRVVNVLNCNFRNRPIYDYPESRRLEDQGAPPEPPLPERRVQKSSMEP